MKAADYIIGGALGAARGYFNEKGRENQHERILAQEERKADLLAQREKQKAAYAMQKEERDRAFQMEKQAQGHKNQIELKGIDNNADIALETLKGAGGDGTGKTAKEREKARIALEKSYAAASGGGFIEEDFTNFSKRTSPTLYKIAGYEQGVVDTPTPGDGLNDIPSLINKVGGTRVKKGANSGGTKKDAMMSGHKKFESLPMQDDEGYVIEPAPLEGTMPANTGSEDRFTKEVKAELSTDGPLKLTAPQVKKVIDVGKKSGDKETKDLIDWLEKKGHTNKNMSLKILYKLRNRFSKLRENG